MLERFVHAFSLDEKAVGKALKRAGIPTDFEATIGFQLDEGITDLGFSINAPDTLVGNTTRANTIEAKLTTFKYDYTSSATSMFTANQFDDYSALPMGGAIGLENHNGEKWLGGLIETMLNGLYPPAGEDPEDSTYRTNSMRLRITQNTDYTDKNGTLVTAHTRGTVLQITRDASRYPHSLRATMFDVLTDYTETPGMLDVGKDALEVYEEGWAAVPGMLKDIAQLVAGHINKVSVFYVDGDITLYIQFYISLFEIESLTWNPGFDFTPYTLDISELISGKVKKKFDEPEEIESDEESITADDIEAAKAHPVTGITLNLGYGLIDETTGTTMDKATQESEALGTEEPRTVSNLRIDIDPILVREITKMLNSKVMSFGNVPSTVPSRATYGTYQAILNMLKSWIKTQINKLGDNVVVRVFARAAAAAASALLDNVLGDQIIHILAKLLPFVEPSKGDSCYLMVEFDTNTPSFSADKVLIRKLMFRASSARTGEYSQIVLTNAGIRLGVVDENRVSIDFDGNTERTLTDVFNIDIDGDGTADYLQDLPKTGTVYYLPGTTSADDEADEVSIIWTDSTFVIDPTGGKTAPIAHPSNGSDPVAISYNLIGSMLNYNKYVPLNIPYSAIRLVKYTNISGKITPMIKGEGIELPLRVTPDEVKKLDSLLPDIVMVYLTDGYGENGMYYTFDGREVGGNVVKWDYSGVSDSYNGGEYILKLIFGDGNTLNYHVDVPIEVIAQPLSTINGFLYSSDETHVITGNSLTFEAGEKPTLPDRVYAEFGTTGSKLYEIRWVESEFTSNYAGATYYVNAYIGNTEIGYHLYENIPVVFKSKVIAAYKFVDENDENVTEYGFEFDPYEISEADGKPKSLSLHSYPRYVYLHFEGEYDLTGAPVYTPCLVDWNLDNVVNNYLGNSNSYATFRFGDESIGYQYVKVFVTIKERVFTSSMLNTTEMKIITDVDPMYLYVDRAKKESRIMVVGLGSTNVYDYDPTDLKNYPSSVTVYYGTDEGESITFSGSDVSWDTSGIVVRYDSGVQYAKLRIGNKAGGYQVIDVPITIEDRTISAIDLSSVRDKYEFDPYEENVMDSKWYPTNPYGATKTAVVVFSSQTAQAYPLTWDLSRLSQSYKGGTFEAYARVGSDKAGWQMVPFTVVVKEKVVKNLQIEAFVFDPYDDSVNPMVLGDESSPYPTTAIAVFKDDSTHRFSNLKWDISALNRIWNYRGGNGVITVKFGNDYGGYQTYDVPVTVSCREIRSVDINEENVLVFDPYGGIDPRLEENYYKKVNVTFTNGEKGVVDVIWDLSEVINNYAGYQSGDLYAEYPVAIRVGNSQCGYQTFRDLKVRVLNREIVGSSMSTQKIDVYSDKTLASTVTVTFKDGSQRTMPVTWINENFRTDINAPDFPNWNDELGIDDQTAFTADARIGDSIGGYQIVQGVPVRVYKRVATKLFIDNVQWSKIENGKMVIDYTEHYFTFDPYDGKMDLPSTVQIFFDDGTDTYMKAVWDTSNVTMDLKGGVYGGYNAETTGAILRLGNARTGYISIEFMVVVKNREVQKLPTPQIYAYDTTTGEKGELLTSIVNDPYVGSGFPNTVWIEFKSTGIPQITCSEGMAKTIGNWNVEYAKDAAGNKIPVRASITLGSAKAGYESYAFDVTTVYRKLSVPEETVVEVNPYQVSLPATLTVEVGGAVGYNYETGVYYALPVAVCGCTCTACRMSGYCGTVDPVTGVLTASCDCDCRCKAQTLTFKADWSKAIIDYTYEGSIGMVDVYVGNQNCGYQKCSVTVRVLNKRVQSVSVEEFEIDPYDYSTLPDVANVTFEDNTSGELKLSANISNAVKDPSNTNVGFFQGGKYTVTAYLGDRTGGYQPFLITLNVKDRTITGILVDGVDIVEDALEIKTYGELDGTTKRPDKTVTAVFADGTTAELKALWSSVAINYDYHGATHDDLTLLVGNSEGGYQRIAINVRVDEATAVSATAEEGFLYNTLLEKSGLPDKIVVTFSEESYVDTLTLTVKEWAATGTIDREAGLYLTTAKIGDDVCGYQWVDVTLPLADIELRTVVGASFRMNGYDEIIESADGRLMTKDGGYFTVQGLIGDDLYATLYVRLLEKPEYGYLGGTFDLAIEVGNDITGYMSETSSGDALTLNVQIAAQVVKALYPAGVDSGKDLNEYYDFRNRMLDPYDMPGIVTGGKIRVLMEGERDITEIAIASVTYRKQGESNYTNYVSYEGGVYTMKIEVGNDLRGRQSKEYEITVARKALAAVSPVAELRDMMVDPFEYRLPDSVTVTFEDGTTARLPVFYEKSDGSAFTSADLKYTGGSFDVTAVIGTDKHGGRQQYGFKLNVKQMLISGLSVGVLIQIDQLEHSIRLPESIVMKLRSGGTATATVQNGLIDNGDWTIALKDGKYVLTVPEGGNKGSWDFSGVDLGYGGGTYYATYKYGNEAAGYQTVQIPVEVAEKVIDLDQLKYVESRTAGSVTLATFGNPREITAAVGEYFDLPTDLWVIFEDGTRMEKNVVWDGSKVDLTKPGRYEITTTVLEQTIKAYVILTEDRRVMNDDVSDVFVAERGGSYTLPTTIRQSIYLRATSGSYYPSPVTASAKSIVWNKKPSTAVEDKYEIVGTVSNGTFEWKRAITLYVYSTYVTYVESLDASSALGTAAGENTATIGVGSVLSPADLPEVYVIVYEGEAATRKKTAAKWYLLDAGGNRLELSALDTTTAGATYVLAGSIVNRAGEEITYKNGEELRFTVKIDENVDLKQKYTLEEGANVFAYGSTGHVTLNTERGVSITKILYKKGETEVGGVTFNDFGEPVGASTYPMDAGEYEAYVTLKGYGKTETVMIPYVVDPRVIAAEDIVIIGLKQWYEENETYEVSFGSSFDVPLEATYEVAEGCEGALTDGIPSDLGKYKVTIRVVSMNYTGEAVAYLEVVEVCTVTFSNGGVTESTLKVEKGKAVKSPPRAAGDNFLCWCIDAGLEEPFDFTQNITADLTLYAKFQS